jgi:hypothetical protein
LFFEALGRYFKKAKSNTKVKHIAEILNAV